METGCREIDMSIPHDTLVWFSQSFGLFYLIGLSLIVVIYAYWPSNKKRFERAASAILDEEDRPWR
jgi:cytochrome c oxidase cbb3-type subunit 4